MVLFGVAAVTGVAAGDRVELPALVATDGGGPAWSTVPELVEAAEAGDPLACFQYAQLLEFGDQVAADPSKAWTYYRRAADAGDGNALFRVGKAWHDGELGRVQDRAEAFSYYQRAALAGVTEATHNVGAMLVSGRGVKRDYVEGLAWLMLAVEQGDDSGSVDQVRQRLRKYPERIATAEKRLAGLKAEIAAGVALTNPAAATSPAPPAPPRLDAPRIAPPPPVPGPASSPPKFPALTPVPTIGVPKITIPQPTPVPPPEPESVSPASTDS